MVRKLRQVCEAEDEQELQTCMNLFKKVLNIKNSVTNNIKPKKLFYQTISQELKSLEASIMIFKSILDADKQEKKESLAPTKALTDAMSDVVSNDEPIMQEKEEPPKQLTAREILKNKIFKLKVSVSLIAKKGQEEKEEIELCSQVLNKLDKLADSQVLDEPSEELNEGFEQLMGVIKEALGRPKRIAHERPLSFACFEHVAFQGFIPEVLELSKPPMMTPKTLSSCIETLKNLYELSNKNPELKVPVNNMKELVRLAFVQANDLVHWGFLRQVHQDLMKLPWEYELEHPDLKPCIEGIQNLYQISEECLSQIKQKLCPETFLPDRGTQIGTLCASDSETKLR